MKLPIIIQRLEGLAIALASLYLYHRWGGNWLVFVPVWLAIDASMAGYLANPKLGAILYNAGHTLVTPLLLYAAGFALDSSWLTLLSLVWFSHIGIDRALGYGLKNLTGFKSTHLGDLS